VVGRFRERGVRFVEDVSAVPEGAIVVFSAHGIPPQLKAEAEERGLQWIDATCPLVTKVHAEASRYARKGFQVLLVGHEDHQEVIGTRGEAPDATIVVESAEDARRIEVNDPDKIVYLTQTTLSTDDAADIIGALKARFPNITEPKSETICYATTNRQQAVRELAPGCDLVLVDDVGEVDWSWFESKSYSDKPAREMRVLVTAGASAPEDLVAGLVRKLIERYDGKLLLGEVIEEDVEFGMPLTLRKVLRARGHDLGLRKVRVRPPEVTEDVYGAVPLTLGGEPLG
jgi:4-hydroxy-3-methylbut-2-enyl diphosphate reductase